MAPRTLCPTCERPPGNIAENKLLTAMCHIPPGFYVRFGVYPKTAPDDTPDGEFFSASVYQRPPEDGWSVRDVDPRPADGWHEVLGSNEPGAYHPADKFADRVLWSVSAYDPAALERLLVHSILEHWPGPRPGLWSAGITNKYGLT